jgi:hypothetical protein
MSQGEDAASSEGNGDDGSVEPQCQCKAQQYNYTIKKNCNGKGSIFKTRVCKKICEKKGIPHTYIRKWKANLRELQIKACVNPNARSCHKGPKVKEIVFEKNDVKEWVIQQRNLDIAVQTQDIINHVIQVRPNFKKRVKKTLIAWVYKSLVCHGLSVLRVTHIGQKLSGHLKEIQDDCTAAIRNRLEPGGTLHGLEM